MLKTSCHCGDVRITLPGPPRVLTRCNCSMCRRIEPLYGYYVGRTIKIDHPEAGLDAYAWGRQDLKWFRCKQCGCFTHHFPFGRENDPDAKAGINLRLADPANLSGIEVELKDGASDTWNIVKSYRFGE